MEYYAEYWLKELQESMDITEITLRTALEPYNQSIKQASI